MCSVIIISCGDGSLIDVDAADTDDHVIHAHVYSIYMYACVTHTEYSQSSFTLSLYELL